MKKTRAGHIFAIVISITVLLGMCTMTATASDENGEASSDVYETTTTTAVHCYATQLEYDDSPMTVGETRAIRFYHPVTQTAAGGSVDEVSGNITVSYEEGSDTVYVTALAAGAAKLYIHESDCAFGAYVYLTVEEDVIRPGDVNGDGNVNMVDAFAIYRYVSGGNASSEISAAADFNGDGRVDMRDAFAVYMPTGGLA